MAENILGLEELCKCMDMWWLNQENLGVFTVGETLRVAPCRITIATPSSIEEKETNI